MSTGVRHGILKGFVHFDRLDLKMVFHRPTTFGGPWLGDSEERPSNRGPQRR